MLVIGHRGWRGKYPENTLVGIEKAIELGVHGIEIDVVANGSSQLVLSHEAWMNPEICASGKITDNIFRMTQEEISTFDCGLQPTPQFPHQQRIATTKPLFKSAKQLLDQPNIQLFLEVKSTPGLFFIGEALDVTGWLGGYNFQWAWSSGWVAGKNA